MPIKITTDQQITQLLKGDVLLKCFPEGKPDEAYEIRNINSANNMIELVAPAGMRPRFTSPGDVARLFIKSGHLITEGAWWLQ
ncbi:hypothetical protein [Taibaiella koreensis]|uniref:hypothetical protein n=1 Tax=Taibaiella koreensis TaxID=1268548 RepID=UPI000E59C72F|nr:hypothetical protein [Taibaiella koreensis]